MRNAYEDYNQWIWCNDPECKRCTGDTEIAKLRMAAKTGGLEGPEAQGD